MAKTSKKTADSKSYRQLRDELDDVVGRLQDPEVDVDEAAKLYEQAVRMAAALEIYLTEAENRIRSVQTRQAGLPKASDDGVMI